MTSQSMKTAGIACLVLAVFLLFVAWNQNQSNAGNVAMMNQMMQSSPLGNRMGGQMKPAMPASAKYALFGAVILGLGGGYCLAGSRVPPTDE